ncbi:MAG: 5-formyltetrahydrofolate cyclo-ligase [Clostridium sp.]|uniref:5-formyltetrahydrofolate cyclo-ligase n=1 Tax=Clostridium sp. TaxID=1506 RepID=UPI003EE47855
MNKNELRKSMLDRRNLIDEKEKAILDKKIMAAFFSLDEYKKAENICIYVNYGSEINTKSIIERTLRDKKEVFVPKMKKARKMDFIKINSLEDLEKNKIGILEPKENFNEKVDKIEILVLPGLAFDIHGGRLGYGGGYYDRYLNDINAKKIALAYELQIIKKVPMEDHDVRYDYLLSEKRVIEN